MMIRFATQEDIKQISQIHQSSLPDDLLPSLGSRFLESFFYPRLFKIHSVLIIVAEDERSLLGFVIFESSAGEVSAELRREIRRRPWPLMRALSTRWAALLKILRTLNSKQVLDSDISLENVAELFVIGVSPEAQGRGIGKKLVWFGINHLKSRGNVRGCIVRTSLDPARKFYKSLGCVKVGEEFRGPTKFDILAFPWNQ